MSTPEIIPEQPRTNEVTKIPEQPEISETLVQAGISVTPTTPKPIISDNSQVIASPVVTTPSDQNVFVVPQKIAKSEKELEKGANGPANLSITWLDATWLRGVKKALQKGWKIVFG